MHSFNLSGTIQKLTPRKGGYFYLFVDQSIVNQFDKKRATRLICKIDGEFTFACGLNHLGDGNFYVIVATKQLETLGKQLGDKVEVAFTVRLELNLGVIIFLIVRAGQMP